MSAILDKAVAALNEQLSGKIDGSFKFDFGGEGSVRIDENGASIDDADADCTLTADPEVFESLLAGDLNPTAAFMTGKLKIDGDMGMAMKLASILG